MPCNQPSTMTVVVQPRRLVTVKSGAHRVHLL